jgi:hypothetical protein
MSKIGKQLAICEAPAGGCGFREGRNWRRGQIVASFDSDGTPRCQCGSTMRAFKRTRFQIVNCQKSSSTTSESYEQWLDQHRAQPGGWLVLAAPEELLRATYEQRLVASDEEGVEEQ